jgi:tetratricopeptide (TPR) repeat protein
MKVKANNSLPADSILNARYFLFVKQNWRNIYRASNFMHLFLPFAFWLLVFFGSGVAICKEPDSEISLEHRILTEAKLYTNEPYSISALKSTDNKQNKVELQRLIEQIHSIIAEPNLPSAGLPAPVPPRRTEPVSINEPNSSRSEDRSQFSALSPSSSIHDRPESTTLPYQPVSDQTLQLLENMPQSVAADQPHNCLQLAEILFLSGHLKQAAKFYQYALNRSDPNDVTSVQDRAWILFQMGNCLRNDDLPTARRIYRQLIVEYPNCPWVDLAKRQESVIDWFVNVEPRKLIEEDFPHLAPRFTLGVTTPK